MRIATAWTGLMLTIATFALSVSAAESPEHKASVTLQLMEKALQARSAAPTQIQIEVIDVQTSVEDHKGCPTRTIWDVDAVVRSAIRGSFHEGDTVHLRYSTYKYQCQSAVTFERQELVRGQVTDAYLFCDPTYCSVADSDWSFTSEPTFLLALDEAKRNWEQYRDPRTIASHPLYKRAIYFELGRNSISKKARDTLRVHADYLVDHPGTSIVLLGNTDDGTSREYELDLGHKRATIVLNAMLKLGVNARQMEVQSVGNFMPCMTSGPIKSRSENRRVDIWYPDVQGQKRAACKERLSDSKESNSAGAQPNVMAMLSDLTF